MDGLLEMVDETCLREFAQEAMSRIMRSDRELFSELEECLYLKINGPHFNPFTYKEAVEALENEDGSKGPHWSLDEIMSLIKPKGVKLDGFNEYDLAYALNVTWSDYSSVISAEDTVVRMALAFLSDKDAPEGKAYLYWRKVIKDA